MPIFFLTILISYAQDIQSERVDTKKKELIGNFYQSGRTWKKEAELVNSHDFPQDAIASCRSLWNL
ncbi:MAG: hypothetical protein AB4368_15440 [Xenococcaceae cyanobacterium]